MASRNKRKKKEKEGNKVFIILHFYTNALRWTLYLKYYNKMIQNLIWATGYNVVAIPLAAGVLYTSGFVLGPAIGAVSMSLSTIIVAINAQLLRNKISKK